MTDLGFHFWDEGERAGLPVVFLHAFPLHSGMWEAQRLALGLARTIRFDVRGLGRSALPEVPCFLEHWVDDLVDLLDHLQIERALLCGLSLGGYLALRAAERNPERVAGLFLADTQAAADTNDAKLKRAEGLRQLRRHGVSPYLEEFSKGALCPDTADKRPEVIQVIRQLTAGQSVAGLAAALTGLATRTDCTDSLARITVPTRVVVGEHDAITPPAVVEKMAQLIPGSDFHVIPGAAHLSNLEAPDAFNELLRQHVQRVGG